MTQAPSAVFDEGGVVAARLRALDLDIPTIIRGAEAGEAERRTCTPFDPNILGGVIAWGRTIRASEARRQMRLGESSPYAREGRRLEHFPVDAHQPRHRHAR